MAATKNKYMPSPEKLVDFMRLQVTDALLDTNIFPQEPPDDAAAPLFALAMLSAIPPVPGNQALLSKTFSQMQKSFAGASPKDYVYNEIVGFYNRYASVFQTSASLPKDGPLANPYEEVAKAAAYQLGFAHDGVRIFHLTVWVTYYCKDAILLFYSKRAKRPKGRTVSMPSSMACYGFISGHVNDIIQDTGYFPHGAPGNATEVFTALLGYVALVLPVQDNTLLMKTFDYMHTLLTENNFPPSFFDRIVQYYERFATVYEANLHKKTGEATNFTYEMLAEEAVKMLRLYPDHLLKFGITSYFPPLVEEAVSTLFSG